MVLDGVKKFFGMTEKQKKLKCELRKAYLYIRNEYAGLSVFEGEHNYYYGCGDELGTALTALRDFSKNADKNSKGRGVVKKILREENLEVANVDDFAKYAAVIETIRSNIPKVSSSLPYAAISDLANISLKYIIYVKSFDDVKAELKEIQLSENENDLEENAKELENVEKNVKKDAEEVNKTLDSLMKKINSTKRDPNSTVNKVLGFIDKCSGKLGRAILHPIDSFRSYKNNEGDSAYYIKYKDLIDSKQKL